MKLLRIRSTNACMLLSILQLKCHFVPLSYKRWQMADYCPKNCIIILHQNEKKVQQVEKES